MLRRSRRIFSLNNDNNKQSIEELFRSKFMYVIFSRKPSEIGWLQRGSPLTDFLSAEEFPTEILLISADFTLKTACPRKKLGEIREDQEISENMYCLMMYTLAMAVTKEIAARREISATTTSACTSVPAVSALASARAVV